MKYQDEYSEAERMYGAWEGVCGRINAIDNGIRDEVYPGHRDDLIDQKYELESKYRQLTGESIKQG